MSWRPSSWEDRSPPAPTTALGHTHTHKYPRFRNGMQFNVIGLISRYKFDGIPEMSR